MSGGILPQSQLLAKQCLHGQKQQLAVYSFVSIPAAIDSGTGREDIFPESHNSLCAQKH